MPKTLSEHARAQLRTLKKSSKLNDTEIADEMERRRVGGKPIYQQKVSDFFSGEMKNPPLEFLSLLCSSLGVKLSTVIAAGESDAPFKVDDDWDWLMFGRRLGPARRATAVKTIEGDEPPVAAPASQARTRPARRKRPGAID